MLALACVIIKLLVLLSILAARIVILVDAAFAVAKILVENTGSMFGAVTELIAKVADVLAVELTVTLN